MTSQAKKKKRDWLVLRSIPWNVSRLSQPVSVASLVVLMEDWSLSSAPFAVSVGDGWVLWQHPSNIPPKQIWIVHQGSRVELMVVHYQRSLVSQTSSKTFGDKEDEPEVGEAGSNIEVFNWQLSNHTKG